MIKMNSTYYTHITNHTDVIMVKTLRPIKKHHTLVTQANGEEFIVQNTDLYEQADTVREVLSEIEQTEYLRLTRKIGEDIHTIEDLLDFTLKQCDFNMVTIMTILMKSQELGLDIDKIYTRDQDQT